jgi:hypothetical protein
MEIECQEKYRIPKGSITLLGDFSTDRATHYYTYRYYTIHSFEYVGREGRPTFA